MGKKYVQKLCPKSGSPNDNTRLKLKFVMSKRQAVYHVVSQSPSHLISNKSTHCEFEMLLQGDPTIAPVMISPTTVRLWVMIFGSG